VVFVRDIRQHLPKIFPLQLSFNSAKGDEPNSFLHFAHSSHSYCDSLLASCSSNILYDGSTVDSVYQNNGGES
jgi:hypothetical protein